MGLPVVIATNGYGTPVTIATNGYGTPVDIATNGYGMPVVVVASGGMPVVGLAIGPDVTPPLAVGFSPTDNATGVNTATLLIVTFDSLVTLGTGVVTLKRTSDNATIEAWDVVTEAGTGAGQVSVEFSTQLTMRLTTSIAAGIEYYVIWDANVVKDIANNPVAANASTTLWSFTTAAAGYDAATEAIAAAFTTPPTTARKNLIDAAVVALKAAGVWDKIDLLEVDAAADSQAALINWKNPAGATGVAVNSPTFTADSGFTGNGSSSYIDTSFNPATMGVNYTQNLCCAFAWSLTAGQSVRGIIGNSASSIVLLPRSASDLSEARVNATSASTNVPASTDGTGLWSINRTAGTTQQFYRNATLLSSGTNSSIAVTSANLEALRSAATYWAGTVACVGLAGSMNLTEQTDLYNALNTYLTAVGAVP